LSDQASDLRLSGPHTCFPTPTGELHRRSNFSRRAFRPAADSTRHLTRPRHRFDPTAPGLSFHGLRHSHETWLITEQIPEIAQALRFGHVLQDKVQETYSRVARAAAAAALKPAGSGALRT
jgi:integrase